MVVTVVRPINERGDVENAVTGACNPTTDRCYISCHSRTNKVCTCQTFGHIYRQKGDAAC